MNRREVIKFIKQNRTEGWVFNEALMRASGTKAKVFLLIPDNIPGTYELTQQPMAWMAPYYIYCFDTKSEAVMFKLRWA